MYVAGARVSMYVNGIWQVSMHLDTFAAAQRTAAALNEAVKVRTDKSVTYRFMVETY